MEEKTVIIVSTSGEEPAKFYVADGDFRHLDGTKPFDEYAREVQLEKVLYTEIPGDDPDWPEWAQNYPELDVFPIGKVLDGAHVISVAII